ncbi:MAG: hypothetical protein AAGF11_47490 [Myxococcota bacterium]
MSPFMLLLVSSNRAIWIEGPGTASGAVAVGSGEDVGEDAGAGVDAAVGAAGAGSSDPFPKAIGQATAASRAAVLASSTVSNGVRARAKERGRGTGGKEDGVGSGAPPSGIGGSGRRA